MRVGIADIAHKCGVSTATVSRALSGNGPVKGLTRDRIIEVARGLGYPLRSDLASRHDASARSIAIITPSLWGDFYGQLLKSVDAVSDDMHWECSGYCGKKQPMIVSSGGPALRGVAHLGGE